jgi:hypothetical protein
MLVAQFERVGLAVLPSLGAVLGKVAMSGLVGRAVLLSGRHLWNHSRRPFDVDRRWATSHPKRDRA